MKRVRLLPIVVLAMSALLVLKGIGIVTEGGYVLGGAKPVFAQAASTPAAAPDGGMSNGGDAGTTTNGADTATGKLSDADVAAANRASNTLFDEDGSVPAESSSADGVPYSKDKSGEKVPVGAKDGVGETERSILERLSERRTELDKRAAQLDSRQSLVEAAEKRLNDRITQLKALEAQITALVNEKKALDDKQFKGLVSMYEAMKPKAAAAIFDQLSMDVLLRVATTMNPRKMSPILAAMTTARAQELTVLMAADNGEPKIDTTDENLAALPQIVGK